MAKVQIIENLLLIVLQYLFLVPILFYLLDFRKIGKEIPIITLVSYCLSIFLFLQIEDFLPRKIRDISFTVLEFGFFTILIYQQIKNKIYKYSILILTLLFLVFNVIYFFDEHKRRIDSIPISIESILIFIMIFMFLAEQIKTAGEKPIYLNHFFWISIGILIYLGGSFFIYLLANTISYSELDKYWVFTYVAEIIKNILIIVSLFIFSSNYEQKPKMRNDVPFLDMH